jgi:hypothetical protein
MVSSAACLFFFFFFFFFFFSWLITIYFCFSPIAHARHPVTRASDAEDDGISVSCVSKERDVLLDFKRGINDADNALTSWQLDRRHLQQQQQPNGQQCHPA